MKYPLDFSLLSRPNYNHIFWSLPAEIEKALIPLTETSARIEGALYFMSYISSPKESLHADEPKATRRREAFLRASLAEYVAIDDTLNRDLVKLNKIKRGEKSYRISDSKNPMLHLVREMRNLEIHLTSSELSKLEKDVIYVGELHTHTIWKLDDLTVEKFKELKNAKNYSDSDINAMVNWFNEAQEDWGVSDIIMRTIWELSAEIVKTYSL
jgi:hypothetical protein